MSVFEYKGVDAAGKAVKGIIDAENERAARIKLRRSQVFPTHVVEEGKGKFSLSLDQDVKVFKFFKKIKISEIAHMTRQLATLLGANIPLIDSLSALSEQVENLQLRNAIAQVKDKVREGSRLADAMRAHPDIFNDLYIHMVRAGEASGALETVLKRLADFTESQAELTSKIRGALTYPVVMSVVGFGLMVFLLVGVVPKITKIFEDTELALPLPTRLLLAVSGFLQHYWYLIILLIPLLVYAWRRFAKTPKGRRIIDKTSLKVPVFGEIFHMVALSRFSLTLSTLLSSGVQLLQAMDIVKDVVQNVMLKEAVESSMVSVREGESLAEPLRRSGYFPSVVVHMIKVGEKTGALEAMLEKIAENYDNQVDTKVSTLTTLLEPIMIILMGGIVSFIVLSILLPILKLNQITR